ncbi:MAG: hypothetical protein EHM40_15685 [Chloroflexi bacterium]|nr:MAG: hypothetical protein EHM40_15685 [Chloroflexota bacterium]
MRKIAKYLPAILVVITIILFLGFKKNIDAGGLHAYHTPHFTIYYEELNQQTLEDLEQKLETSYPDMQSFFSLDNHDNSKVIVYETIERFQRAYLGVFLSYVFGDWAAGAAYKDMVLLTSPENPGQAHTYASILDIAVHEYVHTLIYQVNQNVDIWLDEGVATYLAGQQSDLSDMPVPTFEQMQSQSQSEFVENGGYAWAFRYVEYLVTTYGAEKVVDLIKMDDYEGCLGKSKLATYDEWVIYMGSQ